MKITVLAMVLIGLMMSGCGKLPVGPDEEGWRSVQKRELLTILKEDRYASLCNDGTLLERVEESGDSKLMTKLLVNYANHLANGCIDIAHFKASQRAKRRKKIETSYDLNIEKVSAEEIHHKIKAGESIDAILKPYVPKVPQYFQLLKRYKAMQSDANISLRILKKVRLNLERTKLMKSDLGKDYVLINIPEFMVRLIEDNATVLKFRVIVGKTNMQTPIFSERMRYVEINPQWNVPDSIMRKSYISRIQANPGWVKAKGMELHKASYDLRSPKVDPASVDWSKYPKDGKGYIPYKLVQVPSLRNGLGRVKFIFPNKHAVYMHDTQAKSLFKRKTRCFSHGCIRLGKPVDLLNYITTHYSKYSTQTVKKWYDSLKTSHLILNRKLWVHTVYLTAYVEESGEVKLFHDVYGFDDSQRLIFDVEKERHLPLKKEEKPQED